MVVHLLPVDAWDAQQSLGHAFVVALDDVPRDEPRADLDVRPDRLAGGEKRGVPLVRTASWTRLAA